jgi:hypothetical protein
MLQIVCSKGQNTTMIQTDIRSTTAIHKKGYATGGVHYALRSYLPITLSSAILLHVWYFYVPVSLKEEPDFVNLQTSWNYIKISELNCTPFDKQRDRKVIHNNNKKKKQVYGSVFRMAFTRSFSAIYRSFRCCHNLKRRSSRHCFSLQYATRFPFMTTNLIRAH